MWAGLSCFISSGDGYVGPGGLVICSGILDARLHEVRAGLQAQGLTILEEHAQEDWRCLVARREGA